MADDMGGVSHDADHPAVRPLDRPVSLRRRFLASVAIVLVPLGAATVLLGFVRGLPELLLALLCLAVAALTAYAAMGRRGLGRAAWFVVTFALVVGAAVLAVTSGRQLLVILLGIVVMVGGGSAAGTALLHAPRRGGPPPPVKVDDVPARPVLVVNPRSGGGTAERVGLVDQARERGVRVVELTGTMDLRAEMLRLVDEEGADCLGAAGGDGTLAQVAEVAIERRLPFVCVPAGTRNHFALDLGLDRSDPLGALDAFVDAYEHCIDVAEVNGRMFLNNVSVGAYGEVVAEEQYRERKVGTALAKLPEIIGPEAEPLDLRFTDGTGVEHDSAIVVHVSNNVYDLAPRPGFGTRPSLADGELGIVVVVHAPGLGGPVRVIRWSCPTFRLDSGAAIPAGLDGEALELAAPALFRIRPGVLRVRIPVSAVGASPAGRRPRLTLRTAERLWALALGRVPPY